MKIQILSDLHLEQDPYCPKRINADVLVLAGDIAKGIDALSFIARWYADTPVLYVAGNHEFYGGSLQDTYRALRRVTQGTHVHFLEKDEIVINGVRFLGATLWTDFDLFDKQRDQALLEANLCMNDFDARIRWDALDGPRFRAEDSVRLHLETRAWLNQKMATAFDGPTVVITHHAPSIKSIAMRYRKNHLVTAAYASDLETLAQQADLWIHGHTHRAVDYHIGKCRVVSNPRGYFCEGTGYDPECFVRIGHD